MGWLSASGTARSMRLRWGMVCLAVMLPFTGCNGGGEEANASGQITRPADVGLPLDNPAAVAAFDVADDFLLDWFLLNDTEAALQHVHPNFRDAYRSLLEDTVIDRTCSLLQVEGSLPDASGTVTARYAIGGCRVRSPSINTAVYIELTMTAGEGGPWVSQVEFLR